MRFSGCLAWILLAQVVAAPALAETPRIGVVSASGCYFISPTEGEQRLEYRVDEICEFGLDARWESYAAGLLAEAGDYEPVAISFDRDTLRSVLHDDPSGEAKIPPQFDLKESMAALQELAGEHDVDALLLIRAHGNRLNNGFWMNHTGIFHAPFGRRPVLYYSAELTLVDTRSGKKLKNVKAKGRYTGDMAAIPHEKLDKGFSRQGWPDLDESQRAEMIAKLDEVARDALGRSLPKVMASKKRR